MALRLLLALVVASCTSPAPTIQPLGECLSENACPLCSDPSEDS
jgi:hypothetical protein